MDAPDCGRISEIDGLDEVAHRVTHMVGQRLVIEVRGEGRHCGR